MKKILLSCVTCLLAVGLLAGCDNEEEDVTPDDPNAGVVEPSGDDGGTGGGESGGTETTYKLGVLNENLYSYYYFDGTLDGRFASGTDEWDKGVSLTVTTSEEGSTLSWEEEGATYYLGYGVNESSQNIVTITTEVSYLIINEEHGSIEDPSGKYFLGTYNEYTTFSWNGVNYYDSDFVAHLYTSAQTNPIAPAAPEPTGEMVEVETGVLGLYQGNKGNYYYFTGEINSSNFGVLSTDFTKAVEVTEWKDDAYYYLTIGSEESLQYIACPATSAARMSLTSDPYCLLVDETTGAFVTGDGKEFLGTYRDFETMSWSDVSYLGQEGQFIATIYKEEQKLPAPEVGSITISGATSVYIDSTITLTAVIPSGYDSSVEWSIDDEGHATIEESSGLTCVVKGVSEGDATVTVKSTANPEAYATTTISVVPTPTGVTLLGSFDFSSIEEADSNAISDDTALDDFWTGSEVYVSLRQHDTIYLGSNGSYSPSDSVNCLKFGSGSANGTAELKFALGTSVTQVVVTASGWGTNSGVDPAALTINGVSQDCATSGEPGELTYDIAGSWTNLVKMEASARLTVHSIDIYGTYTTNFGEITTLSLGSDVDTLNIGETTEITVSWDSDVPFDIDTLEWSSDNENVINVEPNYDGASAHAYSIGEATITAKAENGVEGTIALTAVDVLQETETFTFGDGSDSKNYDSLSFYGHQATITFAKGNGSTAPAWYNPFRVYTANTITFTSTYEDQGVTISSIEIKCNGSYYGNEAAEFTNSTGATAGTINNPRSSGCTITLTPTEGITGALTYTNWYEAEHTTTSGQTQLRIESITIHYTLPTT